MQDGTGLCNISVATSEQWTDKNTGQKTERTEWHRIVLYGRLAEVASQYLRKGSKVYIDGRLRTKRWTDKSGIERFFTEIVAVDMQMLDSNPHSNIPHY